MRREERSFAAGLKSALPQLRRYAIALTGSVATADDLVQDCLERAWRGRGQLEQRDMPFSWLRAILYNAHIDWRRRARHDLNRVGMETIEDDLSASSSPDPTAATEMIRALQKLSPDHRHVLLLAGLESLSYGEIAAELAIPIGTVMSRLARARTALRALLDTDARGAGADAGSDRKSPT